LKSILFDARWYGDHGIGRFAREVRKRLGDVREFHGPIAPYHPLDCVYSGLRLSVDRPQVFLSPGYNSPLGSKSFAFTIHDLTHIDSPETRHPLKTAYYELVMKPACRRALRVFTVSEYSRARIAEWSGIDAARIINVSNGVDKAFSAEGDKHELGAPYLFYPGNRKPHKNEPRALRAFARAHARDETKLLFLGEPSVDLLRSARELSIEQRIAFLGRVTDEQLASVYRGAQAVLFPSLFEGFGLPVIEGMACGTPVITSTACALPEVAGDAALLVDPSSEDAIADALVQLKQSDTLAQQLRERGLKNVRRFSWETTANTLREAMAQVL
jgi:glycosyltransferase involved in cell wall biosynthesis